MEKEQTPEEQLEQKQELETTFLVAFMLGLVVAFMISATLLHFALQ